MDLLMLLALLGGIYVLLAFWHFPADWLFQSEKEALAKAKNHLVRARHCLVYAAIYVPLLLLLRTRIHEGVFDYGPTAELVLGWQFWTSLAILWGTHFVIDTYIPVMLWAKYLRRASQFKLVLTPEERLRRARERARDPKGWQDKVVDQPITYDDDEAAFKAFFMTPIGGLLCITMDQLFHLACLWPVAWLVAN
jgi:hypothetical protein